MPGSGGNRTIYPRSDRGPSWTQEPFSYLKVCRSLEISLLVLFAVIAFAVDLWSAATVFPVIVGLAIAMLIVGLLLEKVIWSILPDRIRHRIPYDSSEAAREKGDIRSYRDLPKLLTR